MFPAVCTDLRHCLTQPHRRTSVRTFPFVRMSWPHLDCLVVDTTAAKSNEHVHSAASVALRPFRRKRTFGVDSFLTQQFFIEFLGLCESVHNIICIHNFMCYTSIYRYISYIHKCMRWPNLAHFYLEIVLF